MEMLYLRYDILSITKVKCMVKGDVKFKRSLFGYQLLWVAEKIREINTNTERYLNESESKLVSLTHENNILRRQIADLEEVIKNIKGPFDEISQTLFDKFILNTKEILQADVNVDKLEEEKQKEILWHSKEDARLKAMLRQLADDLQFKVEEYKHIAEVNNSEKESEKNVRKIDGFK